MILGYSSAQIRQAESPLLEAGEPLMQRAAAGLADEIRHVFVDRGSAPDASTPATGAVLLLVGSGDNGGDALFAGAELAAAGHDVRIVTTGSRVHEDGLVAAVGAGAGADDRAAEPGTDEFARLVDGVGVIVDGILGIGAAQDPALRGRARAVVEAIRPRVLMRRADAPSVVAVDIPSGIGPDDGAVPDPMVLPALVTVTFGAVKAGLLLPPASGIVGRIRLVEIGLDLDGAESIARA